MRPLFSLSPEKRRKLRGSLRVLTYCGVVGLVFGAIQLREARAELRSRTVELGREMMKLAHPTEHDVNRITMNGQAIYIASSITKGCRPS